ncbi:MAG TPA: methyltransferase [Methanoculleus sp.]|nr:methyltransferase [Methanoculleus sp.]
MTVETFERVRATLGAIHDEIAGFTEEEILTGPAEQLLPPFRALDRLAATPVPEAVVDALMADAGVVRAHEAIVRLRTTFGLRLEIEHARRILASDDPWAVLEQYHFYRNYVVLGRMEAEAACLSPGDRVAFLGSGPLPLSLIVLWNRHGVRGIGLDCVEERAMTGRCVVAHLSCAAGIAIRRGDHWSFPLHEPCRMVMVAAQALAKEEIFAHLAAVLPPGTLISYRCYKKGLRRLFEYWMPREFPTNLREIARVHPDPPVNNSVVVLRVGEE